MRSVLSQEKKDDCQGSGQEGQNGSQRRDPSKHQDHQRDDERDDRSGDFLKDDGGKRFPQGKLSGSVTAPVILISVIRAMWSMTRALKKSWEMINETIAKDRLGKEKPATRARARANKPRAFRFGPEETHEVLMVSQDEAGEHGHDQSKEDEANKTQKSSFPVVSPNFSPRRLKNNPFKNPMTFPRDRDIIKKLEKESAFPKLGAQENIFSQKRQ